MIIKTIDRSTEAFTRETKNDVYKMPRNLDPKLHPFQQAREYARALAATKLERLHAKPLVGSLDGHREGVYCLAKHPSDLKLFLSGSADGEVRLWNVATRSCMWTKQAHQSFVKGISFLPGDGSRFLTTSSDCLIKLWNADLDTPKTFFQGDNPFTSVDSHRQGRIFASAGSSVQIWDLNRAEPSQTFSWGADTINSVRWNHAETSVIASCATDRSIVLHDIRMKSSLAKMVLSMSTNALCWNPMEAFYFAVASEDHNGYVFDMRYLEKAVNVYRGHSGALLDIDYAPTGLQVVTASYDKTIRLFDVRQGSSRDVYYNRRMQRLFCTKFSMDSSYVLSGSDDGAIRIWKSKASAKHGVLSNRQEAAIEYSESLRERFKEMPEIKRISHHRLLPKHIKSANRISQIQRESSKRKEENRRKHSKPETVKAANIREDVVINLKK